MGEEGRGALTLASMIRGKRFLRYAGMTTSIRSLAQACLLVLVCAHAAGAQELRPSIPPVWDEKALLSMRLPLVVPGHEPSYFPKSYYYQLAARPIYKSYPVYRPGFEPPGYFEYLQQQTPQIAFDPAKLITQEDWIRAGEAVFDAPSGYGRIAAVGEPDNQYLRGEQWYHDTAAPVLVDGTLPFYRYVIREKGKVEIGVLSCAMCHTRVMPDGSAIKGAQGNFPADRAIAWDYLHSNPPVANVRGLESLLYAAPWIKPGAYEGIDTLSIAQIASHHAAIPPGVMARHGTSPATPAKIPDLIGVRDRRYLDATGVMRHRDIGDLMRYISTNQDFDLLARYGDSPVGFGAAPPGMPPDPFPRISSRQGSPETITPMAKMYLDQSVAGGGVRYTDEELYALSLYLYTLKPPVNPNPFDARAARGKEVFAREHCSGCHRPPLYTNNKLAPVGGFVPAAGAANSQDVLSRSIGTDPDLALKTRRGTGFYKVPSLLGVWYRGPFQHSGAVATLEDWFDPRRLREDYVPTGFAGYDGAARAVPGHEFGLKLSAQDKDALIAFLRTL